LIEEFKRGMNGMIREKLIETERSPRIIEQLYKRTTNLNRHWRESKKEEKRLREKWEIEAQVLKTNTSGNNSNSYHSLKFGQGGRRSNSGY